eukprot:517873-Prorocentrum_minimum.AAC.1
MLSYSIVGSPSGPGDKDNCMKGLDGWGGGDTLREKSVPLAGLSTEKSPVTEAMLSYSIVERV